jgi:hypothetical protein
MPPPDPGKDLLRGTGPRCYTDGKMRRILIAALLVAVGLAGANKKEKKKKQFEIQVLETTARRAEGIISVDARVRNVGDRPIEELILLFDIMAAGEQVISTQKTPVDDEELAAGAETSVHVQMRDAVRAVSYRVNATDRAGHDFNVLKSGPYVIE